MLARQLLLERSNVSIPRALEKIGGIQNQYAPNAYIRLRSCLEQFRRDDLTQALQRRTVVQGTLLRGTIHVVSAQDYWHFAVGVRRARREWWLKQRKGTVTPEEMERRAARVRAFLSKGSQAARDLKPLIEDSTNWLDMVRIPPSGTWERRRADIYGLAELWLGAEGALTEQQGLVTLVRRYLGGFGPASLNDIAGWAGVPPMMLAPILERLNLRRFRTIGGDDLFDLPRAPLPNEDTPAPVRFLPTWDATLLVHARRTGILPEAYRKIVFHIKKPQSMGTFLVDGRVAGAWKEQRGKILLEPFGQISRNTRRELDQEAERLLPLYAS
jgi:hypothetical protein